MPPSPILRAGRDGLVLAGLLFGAYLFVVVAPAQGTFGFDAYAYWSAGAGDPYAVTAGRLGAFTYTPVLAYLFAPFQLLPWWQFAWLWTALLVATTLWLGWHWTLAVLAFPPVAIELYHGNVHLLMAAAIALGFRYPAAWAFVLLSKVTPGVGLTWFLVRREWRQLAIALGVTAALVAVSVVLDLARTGSLAGGLWAGWWASISSTASGVPLNQTSIPIPLLVRLPVALVLVAWGARTDRAWTVPVAATLALPVLWVSGLSILAALVPILQRRPGLTGRR